MAPPGGLTEADAPDTTAAAPGSPARVKGGLVEKVHSPLLPRPPSEGRLQPPLNYRHHYRRRHYQQLGLPAQQLLTSLGSYGPPFDGTRDDIDTEKALSDGASEDHNVEASTAEQEGGSAAVMASATAELIAACVEAQRKKRLAAAGPKDGRSRCGLGGASRVAAERKAAERRAGPPEAQCEKIDQATEHLEQAMEIRERERQEEEERRHQGHEDWRAELAQKYARGWLARRRMAKFREQVAAEKQAEANRLWRELRQPRPVRLVCDPEVTHLSEGLENVGEVASESLDQHSRSLARSRYASHVDDSERGSRSSLDDFSSNDDSCEYDEEVGAVAAETHEGPEASSLPSELGTHPSSGVDSKRTLPEPAEERQLRPASGTGIKQEPASPSAYALMAQQEAAQQQLLAEAAAKAAEDVAAEEKATSEQREDSPSRKPVEKEMEIVSSINVGFAEQAGCALRTTLLRNVQDGDKYTREKDGVAVRESIRKVRECYISNCEHWHVKPNSLALTRFATAQVDLGKEGLPEVSYDFSTAHLGDRGAFCVLYALAHDPYCVEVSVRACGLRGPSAVPMAAFLEMHPCLRHADLAENLFSYESGTVILEALTGRSKGRSPEGWNSPQGWRKLPAVTVDLSGTALAWDRGGLTCGPPSGNLWAGHGERNAKFAPAGYEKLRSKLDGTKKIQMGTRSRTPSPSKHGPPGSAHGGGSSPPRSGGDLASPRVVGRAAVAWGSRLPGFQKEVESSPLRPRRASRAL